MKILPVTAVFLGAGLMIAGPTFAQTSQPTQQTAQKQHTDGGFNTGPASGATSGPSGGANKQHTEGGEGPSDGGFSTGPASKAVPK